MAEEKKRDARVYQGERFALLESKNACHLHLAEDDITREDMLTPEYWSHVCGKITLGDEIVVRNDSFTYRARLLVVDVGSGYVKVHVLEWIDLRTKEAIAHQSNPGSAENYEILFKGSDLLHIVRRKSDGAVLHKGERTKVGAQAWLDSFLNPAQKAA